MDATTRYANAAQLAGFSIEKDTPLKDMRAIVTMRAPMGTKQTSVTIDEAKPKEAPDENVFRANYEEELESAEITNQWNFLKQWTLKPADLPIEIDALEENQEHLLMNGWYVVLKETSHWYFRKAQSTDAPTPTLDARPETSADLLEKQETEYAIAQVADYEREQAEKEDGKKAITLKAEDAAAEDDSAKFCPTLESVATAIDDSNRAYKRRLVTGLAANDKLSLSAIHEFAGWVFDNSQEPCTTLEKRRFQEFWTMKDAAASKGKVSNSTTDANLTENKLTVVDGEKNPTAPDDGEKKPTFSDDGERQPAVDAEKVVGKEVDTVEVSAAQEAVAQERSAETIMVAAE